MRLLIVALFVFISDYAISQSITYDKYRAVSLGIGPRFLNTDPGIISTSFTDNSPSMDMFVDEYTVKDNYSRLAVQFGYKWGRYNGLSQSLNLEFSVGPHQSGSFIYSIGWTKTIELEDSWISIRPAFALGFSNFWFDLGQIENNAGYIQIGDIEFYDPYLDVSISSQAGLYGPELGFVYNMFDKIEFWALANYDLPSSNNNPKLEFANLEDSKATISIKEGDNTVLYNGESLTSLPYSTAGFRFTLGISYVWNRDVD